MKNYTIDELKDISAHSRKKLKNAGILYLKDLLIFTPKRLAEFAGMSEELAEKIINKALDFLEKKEKEEFWFKKAGELEEKEEKHRIFLHTGARALDEILGGGWAAGEVTELAGEYRSGKSQTCFTAIATAFLPPEEGGLNDGDIGVVIIDSENTFSVKRMEKIFQRFDIDPKFAKERIHVGRPKNSIHQLRMIEKLIKYVKEWNVKLIIVDSLTKHPRADFSGRKELYDRQRIILSMVEKLRRMAISYNIVVLTTNQVVAVPNAAPYKGRTIAPIGGHVLAHNVDTRLMLFVVSEKKNTRKARIIDSSWLPPGEAYIKITDAGITDVESDEEEEEGV